MKRLGLLIIMAFLAAILPMCARYPVGNGDVGQSSLLLGQEATLHGRDYYGLAVVDVYMNGEKCQMVADTGANVTVLRRDSFNRLFPGKQKYPVQAGAGSNIRQEVFWTDIESCIVGPMSVGDMPVLVLEMPQLGECAGKPVDGLLGLDVLSQFPFVIDVSTRTLSFLPVSLREDILWQIGAMRMPIVWENDQIQALMHLDGVLTRLIMDTGATQTCLSGSQWQGRTKVRREDAVRVDVNGISHSSEFRFVDIASVRWGSLQLPRVEAALGADFNIVGIDLLAGGKLYIDGRRRQVWWLPKSAAKLNVPTRDPKWF